MFNSSFPTSLYLPVYLFTYVLLTVHKRRDMEGDRAGSRLPAGSYFRNLKFCICFMYLLLLLQLNLL